MTTIQIHILILAIVTIVHALVLIRLSGIVHKNSSRLRALGIECIGLKLKLREHRIGLTPGEKVNIDPLRFEHDGSFIVPGKSGNGVEGCGND